MRDLTPRRDLMTDKVTGSTLIYKGLFGGRDGGDLYRFEYRAEQADKPVEFVTIISTLTPFMFDRLRKELGLPKVESITERKTKHYPEFTARYGSFNCVQEWYLIGTDGKALAGPPEAQRTWAGFTRDESQQIIDTFCRLYFELTARRPGVTSDDPEERYYPDLLKFEPYDLPKELIQERQATLAKEI
jgi:hypothetical protein